MFFISVLVILFAEKVAKFVQPHFYFIAVGLLISFLAQFMSCVERNTKSTIEQQNYKDSEIHDRLLILIVILIIRFPS